ncbi:AsmA-like C-terminal region-containing protein [candidate division NPL-UPA2 bacterium]|nr:AsmA-like C-terminal region-containing protein [candidate division NPL-UPA2 bacterium]
MRGRKRFLTYSLLFLLLLIGALFLAYKFVIPVLIEQAVEERLSRGLEKEVRLGKVDLNLFRKIKFHQLLVYEPEEEKKIFLQVEELQIDYCYSEILDNLREKGKNFRKWQLTLEVTSSEIIFRGWRLESLYLPLRVESSQLIAEDLEAKLYEGSLKGSFSLNLASDQKDYQFEGTLSGLDLNRLVVELGAPGEKEIRGILEVNFHLKGTVGELKNLSGYGEVSIVEGKLWELPLLGDLMAILPVPSLEGIVFREGKMSFAISEGIVATEDLTLTSDQVKVRGQGKIDFQGYFWPSLTYRISFSKGLLDEVPLIGDIISFIIDEAGYLIAQVEVTGSLKEPKHRLIPLVKGIEDFLRIFQSHPGDDN